MAVAFRTERPKKSARSAKTTPVAEFDRPIQHHEPEAPDRGAEAHEAPEGRLSRRMEAPDAGEGRAGHHESEFTHGRCQS
jgi:hypothetical protein